MHEKFDVCYFSGRNSKYSDWELRYSIRSVESNFLNLRNIWLIGQCPDFIAQDRVNYVWFPDEPTQNKDRNLIQKLAYLSGEAQLTEEFIINSDDHFILKPLDISSFMPYIEGDINYRFDRLWERRFLRTQAILKEFGFTQWNYDTHIPQLVTKRHSRELLKFNFGGSGLCAFSLYFNTLLADQNPRVITNSIRMDARRKNLDVTLECAFGIANDRSMRDRRFIEFIEGKFPNKSRFEL